MKAKRAVKEHERALKRDPGNINIRIKLASALRELGKTDEAAQMYLSVARAYQGKGRTAQAIAVCNSVLEISPTHAETVKLLADLQGPSSPPPVPEADAASAGSEDKASRLSGRFSGPLLTPTPLPDPVALHEVAEETEVGSPLPESRPTDSVPSTPGGARVSFGPAPLAPAPAEESDKIATGAFPHKTVKANVSFKKKRPRRPPRNRAAEAAAELAKELETETQGAAISPKLPQALSEIAAGMHLKHFPRGEMILREGEAGNALYLIVSGKVRVLKVDPRNPDGDLIEIATLDEGEIFGEFAILADFRRHASVQAVADCHVYEIPRDLVGSLTTTYPEMAAHLEGYYRDRLLDSLLSTSAFFQPLEDDVREAVLKKFTPVRVESDRFILTEGEDPGAFHIILLGSVDVLKSTGPESAQVVATLTEGDHFGAAALLCGEPAAGSIMTTGPTELARLSLRDFYEVVADNPVLWSNLRVEAQERQLLLDAAVAS